jgi:hypothetical protein
MKNYLIISILLTAVMIITGCEKEIDLDINNVEANYVIQAKITNESTPIQIKISQNGSYFQKTGFPNVNNAVVSISSNGNVYDVPFVSDGKYELNNFVPISGNEYSLNVTIDEVSYTANTIFPQAIEIQDTIFVGYSDEDSAFIFEFDILFPTDGYFLRTNSWVNDASLSNYRSKYSESKFAFEDPAGEVYVIKIKENSDFEREIFNTGDVININFSNMDKITYKYFTLLDEIKEQDIGSRAGYNPKNNFDQPNVLGYFGSFYTIGYQYIVE